eukprot:767465-Hanusia_phi.AAC.3
MASVSEDLTVRVWRDKKFSSSSSVLFEEECVLRGQHTRPIYHVDWLPGSDVIVTSVRGEGRRRGGAGGRGGEEGPGGRSERERERREEKPRKECEGEGDWWGGIDAGKEWRR